MKKNRILVTGAGGMAGSYAPKVFEDWDTILTDVVAGYDRLDIHDPSAVMKRLSEARPDVVLHLAAATNVDRCEQYPDEAYLSNAIGTQNVALACQSTGAVLVYIGTGAVFNGEKPDPYLEYDLPSPANVYGHSKLAGEQIVASLLQRYYIVRASWIIGGGAKDKKFIGKIVQLLLDGRKELLAVDDKFGSPAYAKELLYGIKELVGTGYYGLYHMVNTGMCSRYEVALAVRDALGLSGVAIRPVSSAHFPLPAPRPRSEALRNMKLDLLGLNRMQPWQDAVREYVAGELVRTLGIR